MKFFISLLALLALGFGCTAVDDARAPFSPAAGAQPVACADASACPAQNPAVRDRAQYTNDIENNCDNNRLIESTTFSRLH